MIPDHAQPRLAGGVRLAHEIVTRCDGRPLSEIVLGLAQEYDVDLEMLAADVRETLADLQRRKLVKFA